MIKKEKESNMRNYFEQNQKFLAKYKQQQERQAKKAAIISKLVAIQEVQDKSILPNIIKSKTS